MTRHFLVDQLRTAYQLSPPEAEQLVRSLVATVSLDDLADPAASTAFHRWPFKVGQDFGPVAVQSAMICLFNPLNSGVTAVITGITHRSNSNAICTYRFIDTIAAFANTGDVEVLDFRLQGAPRSTPLILAHDTDAAQLGLRVGDFFPTVASFYDPIKVILKPGTGLNCQNGTNNVSLFACFEGYVFPEAEKPAP